MPRPRRNYNNRKKPMRKRRNNNKKRPSTRRVYNKNYKKGTAKILQPIAEGRKVNYIHDLSPIYLAENLGVENWKVLIPATWLHMYRESFLETLPNSPTSHGFTGNTLFSRYLNQQVKVSFENITHIGIPVSVHVCYGWCKLPYLTPLQSQGSDSATNVNNVLVAHKPELMITRSLANMFQVTFPRVDPKQFKLMYNKEFQVRGQSVSTTSVSGDPDEGNQIFSEIIRKQLNYSITWKPNTKYHMRPATTGDGSHGGGPEDHLKPDMGAPDFNVDLPSDTEAYWTPSAKTNGDLWIPFFAIQIKNAGQYGKNNQGGNDITAYPYIYNKDTHYFYDL